MCCVRLRTLAVIIGVVFFATQTAVLAFIFATLSDLDDMTASVAQWMAEEAEEAQDFEAKASFLQAKSAIQRKLSDFLAIPITVSIILMASSSLLIWAALARHKILLWPWLTLHLIEWFCFAALLVFFILIMPQPYMKVILFLVVCPFLVVFAFCWFAIKCLYDYLGEISHKEKIAAAHHNHNQPVYHEATQVEGKFIPPTVYKTGEQANWDHPLPVWSQNSRQQRSTQTMPDPRYPLALYRNGIKTRRHKSSLSPRVLPDGTLVVPIADEGDDLTEIEEEDETVTSSRGSRSNARLSDDGRSIVSLSDKYKQQDEVEVFEEFYPAPPPKPVPPRGGQHSSSI